MVYGLGFKVWGLGFGITTGTSNSIIAVLRGLKIAFKYSSSTVIIALNHLVQHSGVRWVTDVAWCLRGGACCLGLRFR